MDGMITKADIRRIYDFLFDINEGDVLCFVLTSSEARDKQLIP
jgi:hypothetical protein